MFLFYKIIVTLQPMKALKNTFPLEHLIGGFSEYNDIYFIKRSL
jgi:hypothetical protein